MTLTSCLDEVEEINAYFDQEIVTEPVFGLQAILNQYPDYELFGLAPTRGSSNLECHLRNRNDKSFRKASFAINQPLPQETPLAATFPGEPFFKGVQSKIPIESSTLLGGRVIEDIAVFEYASFTISVILEECVLVANEPVQTRRGFEDYNLNDDFLRSYQ